MPPPLPPFGPFEPFARPLPPPLERLHALLEAHAEATEEGVLIVEHDHRPVAGEAASPVIVYVPSARRPGAASGRVAPELIAEVLPGVPEREARYARAGVQEYWRVEPGPEGAAPRIHVLADPDAEAGRYRSVVTHAGDDPVRSAVLPGLVLRPADLIA